MARSRGESRRSTLHTSIFPELGSWLIAFPLAVISFMSALGPSRNSSNQGSNRRKRDSSTSFSLESPPLSGIDTPNTPSPVINNESPAGTPTRSERRSSRPASTVFSHKPPQMQVAQDTPAELQPIFAYLNSHANKLYQEGYFLKLNDLDSRMSSHIVSERSLDSNFLYRWSRLP